MPPEPDFELTAHAATVIAEREIDIAWITRTLERPDRTETDRDDRILRVVYNPSVNPLRVVTAYFDRRQRGKP